MKHLINREDWIWWFCNNGRSFLLSRSVCHFNLRDLSDLYIFRAVIEEIPTFSHFFRGQREPSARLAA
jgi:hypothetical protein